MKKRCMLLLIMALLLAQFNILPVSAADLSGDFYYIENADTTSVTITGYIDSAPRDHVVIPQTINGKRVTAIGDEAFQNKSIQSLELPEGLVSIGTKAFYNNPLTSLEIPGSVKDIGQGAFQINKLTSLTLNDGVEKIGIGAFANNGITTLNLPDSVTEIEDSAFFGNRIAILVLPNNLVEISDNAFYGNRLTSIDIPASVRIIGDSAFSGNRISALVIPSTVTDLKSSAFHYNALASVTFLGTPSLANASVFSDQYSDLTNSDLYNWYTDTAYTQVWDNTVTSPMTIYAAWKSNRITFNANGGSVVDSQSINFGEKGTAVTPTKTEHTFAGWYKEAAFINPWDFNTDIVIRNITLFAKWTANTYTVSFNLNGGTGAAPSQTIEYDGKVASPANPSKAGHTFEGWYTNLGSTSPWNFDTDQVKGNMTLHAKWTANTYKVTFQPNGGTPVTAQNIVHDGKVALPVDPSKPGHSLEGWYTDSDLTTPWDFGSDLVKGSMTLYAKWTANTYTVDFQSNGGTSVAAQTITYYDKVVLPANPSKAEHTFAGWYMNSILTTPWDFDTNVVVKNMTLYAKWNVNTYTVSFQSTGGSAVAEQVIAYDDKVVLPAPPIKAGHIFVDWYKDEELTTRWMFASDVVTEDITLYAEWDKEKYTISFETSGGSEITDQQIAFEENAVKPADPQKPGYTFVGWFKDEDLTLAWNFATDVVIADMTLYAKWLRVETPGPIVEPEPIPEEEPIQHVCSTKFADISNHWADDAITDIASRCIIIGYPDGEFKPNAPLIRAHVAVMFTRALELSSNRTPNSFYDVSNDSPYYEAILKVSQAGIFEGTSGYFYPDQQLTRAQMAKILVIAFNLQVGGESTFQDVPKTHWGYSYIAALESYGLAFGEDGYYKPEEPVTRAEFVAFMYRALHL